jgi:hypothetical protein
LRFRLSLALAVALVGTVVFLGLRDVLFGLIDPPAYILFCFVGAFVSSMLFASPMQRRFVSLLPRATGIVLLTYVFISVGHLAHHIGSWDYTVPTEAMNLLLWALVTTSWWLIPLTAVVLKVFSRMLSKHFVSY